MTNIMTRKTTDKRGRLIQAATIQMHQLGFNLTTLAKIAEEADVPLGNVYYYFKTKEAIGVAVIEKLSGEFAELLRRIDEMSDPIERLGALLELPDEELGTIARYGSAVGCLCQELSKQGGALADQAAKLLDDLLKWAEKQFLQIGCGDMSEYYAKAYVANVEGTYLLMHAFKDPNIAKNMHRMFAEWLHFIDKSHANQPAVASVSEKEEQFV